MHFDVLVTESFENQLVHSDAAILRVHGKEEKIARAGKIFLSS